MTCDKDGNSAAARFGFHASHLEVLPDFMLESLVALPDRVPEGISSGGYLAESYELPDRYSLYFSDGLRFRNGCGTLLIFSRREGEKLEILPTSRPGVWLKEASPELVQAYNQALQRCETATPSVARRLGYCIAFDPQAIIATEGGNGYGVVGESAVAAHTLEFTLSSPEL